MISAEEARKISEEVTTAQDNALLKKVEVKITQATEKGQRSINVEHLSDGVIKKLKDLGYTYRVDHDCRGDGWQTISW